MLCESKGLLICFTLAENWSRQELSVKMDSCRLLITENFNMRNDDRVISTGMRYVTIQFIPEQFGRLQVRE